MGRKKALAYVFGFDFFFARIGVKAHIFVPQPPIPSPQIPTLLTCESCSHVLHQKKNTANQKKNTPNLIFWSLATTTNPPPPPTTTTTRSVVGGSMATAFPPCGKKGPCQEL